MHSMLSHDGRARSIKESFMLHANHSKPKNSLFGFNRSTHEQALENLKQALRALDMVPVSQSDFIPNPLVIVRAEIENARRYLSVAEARLS